MSVRNKKQYWDSAVLIELLQDGASKSGERRKADNVADLLAEIQRPDSDIIVVVSTFVVAEIRPSGTYNQDHWKAIEELFYRVRDYMRVVSLTPPIASTASRLGAEHPTLTVPDCVHLATALMEGAGKFLTYDGECDKARNWCGGLIGYQQTSKNKIGSPPLDICEPVPTSPRLL